MNEHLRGDKIAEVPLIKRLREARELIDSRSTISFTRGDPNSSFFPINEIIHSAKKILEETGEEALSFGEHAGYMPLRQYIADYYLKTRGVHLDAKHIIITTGSQQGLDLTAKVFLRGGGSVVSERPTYVGALEAFLLAKPEFLFLDIENDGVNPGHLREVLDQNKNKPPQFCYFIPDFQNPTGARYAEKRREETATIVSRHDVLIVEDDRYGNLYFDGGPLPLFRSYLENTIILGSFSTLIAPGLRLGWLVATEDTLEEFLAAKHASDIQSSHLLQLIVYHYLIENDLDRHLAKLRTQYRKQRDRMCEAIRKYLPQDVSYNTPQGGYFLWVTLPSSLNADELLPLAVQEGASFSPGSLFYLDDGGKNALRLNFSGQRGDLIEKGIHRLSLALGKLRAKKSGGETRP